MTFIFGLTERQDAATIEHVIPRIDGGMDHEANYVIACSLCNQIRNRANPWRFERTVLTLLKNPVIHAAWHKFTESQVFLLRQEVQFSAIKENRDKRPNNLYGRLTYHDKMIERLTFLTTLNS